MSRRINLLLTLLLLLFVSSTHANEKKEEKESGSGEGSEYLDIRPAIITNYGGPGPIHFVKVDMSLRLIKDPDAQSKVAHHLPHIRHELIMLLSKQSADNIMDVTFEPFPCVQTIEVLEHLDDPVRFLTHVRRLLQPGGIGFIAAALTAPQADHIYLYWTPDEVIAHLRQAGFTVEDYNVEPGYVGRPGEIVPKVAGFIVSAS